MKRFVILIALAALAGPAAAPAHAEDVRIHRTPDPALAVPAVDGLAACFGDVDCAPDLEGAPPVRRPERVWSVRSSGLPATEDYAPAAPMAIIVDVDAEDLDHHDPGRPPRPRIHRRPNLY